MSTCGVSQPLKGYVRDARRRRRALNLDLNGVPSSDNTVAAVDNSAAHDVGSRVVQSSGRVGGGDSSTTTTPAAIDVDAIDDEVLFSSPRRFAEARERSRRNNGAPVVLVEGAGAHQGLSEERMTRMALNRYKKCRRVTSNQGYVNSELYINLEGDDNGKRKNTEKPPHPAQVQQPPPPPPPPKELTFNCPVCMGPLVEEMSTKCGHIFCKKCIKAAIAAQNKCPTCRRKLSMKDTIRIYLPSAS